MRIQFSISIGIIPLFILFLAGCYGLRSSSGGGEVEDDVTRIINAADIALPDGYLIEVVAEGLTFPTGIAFDDQDRPYVIEAGYSYGEEWTQPRLLRVEDSGQFTVIASGNKNGPWNGMDFFDGNFYIAEGGHLEGGKLLKVNLDGEVTALVEGLPSFGDHHTNGPVVRDDYIYFGQGTATNSGVVGNDNAQFGWLSRNPKFHDIPCEDISLAGKNFETENVLTEDSDDITSTGAFSPYGTPTSDGEVIPGRVPCNGAIMRIPVGGGEPELVAWGLRNPYGLTFSPDGRLFVTDNGYDERGSRPVWGTGDLLWEIETGMWYGWPDYSGHKSIAGEEFKAPGNEPIESLLAEQPNQPPEPVAVLGVHSSSNGPDVSEANFGPEGEVFIAQFGDMAPGVGKVMAPVGFKVIKVDPETGVIEDFAVNKGETNGPATWLETGGLERPVSVKFSPDGRSLYIVDFGIMKTSEEGPEPVQKTGVIFKVTREVE